MSLKLDFICIGAPKCGTTSLYHYLKQHPRIYLPEKKELHYFSRAAIKQRMSGPGDSYALDGCPATWSEYQECYLSAGQGQLKGDISPSYFQVPACFSDINERFPQVKILVLLRNPVAKAISQHTHLVREAREMLDFEAAISAEGQRCLHGFSDFWEYRKGGLYSMKISALFEVFGRERVKVVFQEHLANKPILVMNELAEFLGVNKIDWQAERQFNQSGAPKSRVIAKILAPGPILRVAKNIIPYEVGARVKEFISSKNISERDAVAQHVIDELMAFYKEDVSRLVELIGPVPWELK